MRIRGFPAARLPFSADRRGVTRRDPAALRLRDGVTGASALFLGKLFDRYGIVILVLGTIVSLLTLPLGFLGGQAAVIGSAACWAIGLGAQDATLRAGIAQVVSDEQAGVAPSAPSTPCTA